MLLLCASTDLAKIKRDRYIFRLSLKKSKEKTKTRETYIKSQNKVHTVGRKKLFKQIHIFKGSNPYSSCHAYWIYADKILDPLTQ